MIIMQQLLSSYCRELGRRRLNVPAILLVLYCIPMSMTLSVAYNITYATVTSPSDPSPWAPLPEISTDAIFLAFLLQVIVLSSTYLLAGWIADMVIGRDKAITVSLSSCWFAILLQISSYVVQYNTFGQSVSIAKYGVSSIALVLITIGTVLFFSIFLAYGMDQLLYEPSATMRAFIHWIAWGMSMGHTVSYLAFFQGSILYDPPIIIGSTVCVFGLLTMALVLHICLKDKFLSNNKLKDNPYTMAVRILLYAYRHKFPQNRSAFGQWEHDKPGRVDLAKCKYGGPFMNDSVENTKVFGKILLVLLASFGIYIPYKTILNGFHPYVAQYSGGDTAVNGFGSYLLYIFFNEMILIAIPVFELIIVPLRPKIEFFCLKPLHLMIFSNILMILTLLSMLIMELIGGTHAIQTSQECSLIFCPGHYSISYLWYIVVFIFAGLLSMFNYIGVFEFICSQAPSSSIGMLTSCFWFIRGAYMLLGCVIPIPFLNIHWQGPEHGSAFWILAIEVTLSAFGLLCLCSACIFYKLKKQVKVFAPQVVIESHFEKVLCSSSDTTNQDDILEIDVTQKQVQKVSDPIKHSIQKEMNS